MAISVSSRIRNAMVGLSLALCALFAALIFLLVYIIEDQVFVNQIKLEKLSYESSDSVSQWKPGDANIRLINSPTGLPAMLPNVFKAELLREQGVHEYFDDEQAMFIAHYEHPTLQESYFLVYDVRKLLAVRGSKQALFKMITVLTLLIAVAAFFVARRLTRATLSPVRKLSDELQSSEIDDVVIDMASEFSSDEVGVLARELAIALGRARDSAQREIEFNRGVSHELRTPIQVAQSTAELLEIKADESVQVPIQRLKRSVTEMNEVVETFLWLASDRELSTEDRCLASELGEVASNLAKTLPQLHLDMAGDLTAESSYPLPRNALTVVIRSLINNANKHGVDGTIHLAISAREISVSNPQNSATQSSVGFGMGLPIVRRICDRFHCSLTVSDEGESVFRVAIAMP